MVYSTDFMVYLIQFFTILVVSSLKLGNGDHLQSCLLVHLGFEIDINLKWFHGVSNQNKTSCMIIADNRILDHSIA